MKVLTLFNDYRSRANGEYVMVKTTQELLRRNGVETLELARSSAGLDANLRGKARAFFSGLYNVASYRQVREVLHDHRPAVVHAHNLYPLLSPSVLVACRHANVPTVMTLHNFGLTCPTWAHFRNGAVCEKCFGGREYWCVLKNCRASLPESLGYGLRAAVARKLRLFHRNVTLFTTVTEFARGHFIRAGFDEDRISVVYNTTALQPQAAAGQGRYVACAGRIAHGKGTGIFIEAAQRLPELEFRIAGEGPLSSHRPGAPPKNLIFEGFIEPERMGTFYDKACCLVLPSTWYEMCPLVVLEAMAHGVPVIASRIGGLPELVEDGVTGLLFTPGDLGELVSKIRSIRQDPAWARQLGGAGRERLARQFGEDRYVRELMEVYDRAMRIEPRWSRSAATPAAR